MKSKRVGSDMSQGPGGAQLTENNVRLQLGRKLVKLVWSGFPLLCILFQLFRLGSLVMFSIFLVDCILYHGSSSLDCTNFTVYDTPKCDPYCWETVWLACSIVSSTVYICLINTTLPPELRPLGNKAILKCLLRKPYFWSLNTLIAFVVLYDVLIMFQNKNEKVHIGCLVIVSKLWTLCLLYQLNFTSPPSTQRGFRPISRAAYCITLSIYALDNLCRFLANSTEVAFKFYTVNRDLPEPLTIVNLMLMILNATLYHSFLQFFWQKLFRSDEDILKVVKQKFVDSKGIREYINNNYPV